MQERLEIPVLTPGRPPATIRRSSLPAPLHLAGALLGYPRLPFGRRLAAARAALALARLDPADPALERETFGDWLARHGQDDRAVAALWDLIALPTMNVPAADASLALAAFVFQDRPALGGVGAGDIGFHVATLQQILGDPALRALRSKGVEVRLGWRAERLERGSEGYCGERPVGHRRRDAGADAVVVALPHDRAGALLEPLLGPNAGRPRRWRARRS